jgi:hypothetical protein
MTTIANATAPSFEVLLDKMLPHCRYYAKRVIRRRWIDFDDVVQDLCGIALEIYQSLVRRGKEVFYSPIMKFTIKKYREGRRFCGQNSTDILSCQTQKLGRSAVCQLVTYDQDDDDLDTNRRMEYPQPSVVDFVQMKMDYQGWYHLQSPRDQKIIDDLSMGYTTGEVAKKFGVSDGLISIKRKNFANSWKEYQAVA